MFTPILLFTVLYTYVHIAAAEPCQQGWVNFETSCYKYINVNATWGDALAICMTLNAHLVEIDTKEENGFIKGKHQNNHNYWIGGNDIEIESVWRWITSRNPITFFDWAPLQPSNLRHRQDCVLIHKSNHQWHDFDCRAENFFICEKDALTPDTTTTTVMTTQSLSTTQERTTQTMMPVFMSSAGTEEPHITNIDQNTDGATMTASNELIIEQTCRKFNTKRVADCQVPEIEIANDHKASKR